jgi:hypothetical protein
MPLPFACPNEPPCPHPSLIHDIEDFDDETPRCCFEDCDCGAKPAAHPDAPAPTVAEYFRTVANEIDQVDPDEPGAATAYCIAIRITGAPNPFDSYGYEIPAGQFRAFVGEHERLQAENDRLRARLESSLDEFESAILAVHEMRDYWQNCAADAETKLADLKGAHGRRPDYYYGGIGARGVIEVSAFEGESDGEEA